MHKRAFQGLKCTFMYLSGLPPPYFHNKTKYFISQLYYQKMVGEDLKHA